LVKISHAVPKLSTAPVANIGSASRCPLIQVNASVLFDLKIASRRVFPANDRGAEMKRAKGTERDKGIRHTKATIKTAAPGNTGHSHAMARRIF
jgi:hypothetical protein